MTRKSNHALLAELIEYFSANVTFPDPAYALVLSLYTLMTWVYSDALDIVPYLVVRSATKQSGKTTVLELLQWTCKMAAKAVGVTKAQLARLMSGVGDMPKCETLIMDEAEDLNKPSLDKRQVVNDGYKRGAKSYFSAGKNLVVFETFGPKVMGLIGDIYDTARDRSVMITMVRGKPPLEMERTTKEAEGSELKEKMGAWAALSTTRIRAEMAKLPKLDFLLNSRSVEIWRPLFVICQMLDPTLVEELTRVAVDTETDKTVPCATFAESEEAERLADDTTYGTRLIKDIQAQINGAKFLWTEELVAKLRDMPTAPWRRFRGNGLHEKLVAQLLRPFNVQPKLLRKGKEVKRGYTREAVDAAIAKYLA